MTSGAPCQGLGSDGAVGGGSGSVLVPDSKVASSLLSARTSGSPSSSRQTCTRPPAPLTTLTRGENQPLRGAHVHAR
jgi:hypothetical protein